jgi:hypothetical protein
MQRPGALTALAVINFILSAFGVATVISCLFALKARFDPGSLPAEVDKDYVAMLAALPLWTIYTLLVAAVLKTGLWIASGVGYLQLRKVLGWGLGNAYAVVSLAETGIVLAGLPYGFQSRMAIAMLYPLITLLLLNRTFKDAFTG